MFLFTKYKNLYQLSWELRLEILNLIHQAHGGHIGGSLSSLDLMIAIYYSSIFKFPPDHFILSAGHLCPALYVVLSRLGYFPPAKLATYAEFNSPLQGHASRDIPGVEYSSGLLGQGLSFAAGLAMAQKHHSVICLTTDGEHQEGQVWEAIAFANKYRLSNLINLVDFNHSQIDGSTDDIMPLGDLAAKYLRFGWTVTTVDGHDFNQIISALKKSPTSSYPHCIIAHTVLGKGISFMQHDYHYHDVKNLSDNLYLRAKNELENQFKKYD